MGELIKLPGMSPQDRADEALRIWRIIATEDKSHLTGDETSFLTDMVTRIARYGRFVHVSETQLLWLRDIKDKIIAGN